jgi:hypothetical protein
MKINLLRGSWRGGPNPISHLKFWQIPSPSWILLEIPVWVTEIPVNKKKLFIGRINSFKTF